MGTNEEVRKAKNTVIYPNLVRISADASLARSCRTLWVWPGKMKSGAISLRGSSTNFRKCARGCGRVSAGLWRISGPKLMRSKSSRRASFNTCLGRRPNSTSKACSWASNDSGDSPALTCKPAQAFTKGGDPGGQSTGVLCQSEERTRGASDSCCNRARAASRVGGESPRFYPRER